MKKIFLFLLLIILPFGASAQTVFIVPEEDVIDQKEFSTFDIRLDTEGYFINVIELYVSYAGAIDVLDISIQDSFVDVWVSEPRITTSKKEIQFIGGLTTGTVMNDGLVAHVLVQGKTNGETVLTVDEERSAVYRDDGIGTRVSLASLGATISVSENAYTPTIEIYSSSHPKEDVWYSNNTLTVAWDALQDDVFSYNLSQDFSTLPDDAPEGMSSTKEYSHLEDGEYLFTIKKEITPSTWSDVSKRRFHIDVTPPSINDATILEKASLFDGNSVVVFDVYDDASGLSRVTLMEGEKEYKNVISPYILQANPDTVTIIAEDNAGNTQRVVITRSNNRSVIWVWYVVLLIVVMMGLFTIRRVRRRGTLSIHEVGKTE